MKILWFANTSCSAADILKTPGLFGGWLRALEEELVLSPEIQLSISFYSNEKLAPFRYRQTQFYPLYRKRSKLIITRAIKRMVGSNSDRSELETIKKLIEEVKPELIHIHGTEENFGLLQSFVNLPVLISIQGIINECVKNFYAGIPRNILAKYEPFLHRLLFRDINSQYRMLIKNVAREQHIISIGRNFAGRTAWDKQIVSSLAPKANYYISNEILRGSFYLAEWKKERFGDCLDLITTTSDNVYKGFEMIVDSARRLKNKNVKFRWRIIGLSEKSTTVVVVRKWKNADLAELNIKLLGDQNEEKIAGLLISSDIYCHVSHIENSSNSLCEAMLVGMPVIASDAGGTRSIVNHNQDGVLFSAGNPDLLTANISEFASDFGRAARFGKAARQKALIRHDKLEVALALKKVYRSILKN